jgi:hypothetical protein
MTAIPTPLSGFAGETTGADVLFAATAVGVPAPAADPSNVIARLNSLLRGEIAAAETYRNVLERMSTAGHTEHVESLGTMQADHGRSSQAIRGRIDELGGVATDSSGAWGIWAQAVEGTLSLFGGDVGGLRALREGEEHGQRDYESALNEVDAITARLIQDRLLPAQQAHVAALDRMLAAEVG